ncbi:hypothetical protein HDV00_002135 [Rhizophlyctis rosea]|nr:hypothetical protein HDV00_002135 [Rhizophlyctis rosea]
MSSILKLSEALVRLAALHNVDVVCPQKEVTNVADFLTALVANNSQLRDLTMPPHVTHSPPQTPQSASIPPKPDLQTIITPRNLPLKFQHALKWYWDHWDNLHTTYATGTWLVLVKGDEGYRVEHCADGDEALDRVDDFGGVVVRVGMEELLKTTGFYTTHVGNTATYNVTVPKRGILPSIPAWRVKLSGDVLYSFREESLQIPPTSAHQHPPLVDTGADQCVIPYAKLDTLINKYEFQPAGMIGGGGSSNHAAQRRCTIECSTFGVEKKRVPVTASPSEYCEPLIGRKECIDDSVFIWLGREALWGGWGKDWTDQDKAGSVLWLRMAGKNMMSKEEVQGWVEAHLDVGAQQDAVQERKGKRKEGGGGVGEEEEAEVGQKRKTRAGGDWEGGGMGGSSSG